MSRIITAEEVRTRMSLQDDPGVNTSIESALDASLVIVESVLSTTLSASTSVDTFYLDAVVHDHIFGLYTLRMNKGFIHSDPAPVIQISRTLADLDSGLGDSVSGTISDWERGMVKVPDTCGDHYVRVSYSYGFEEDADEDEIPSWLKELVLVHTILVLTNQQIADGNAELSKVAPFIDKQWRTIADNHLRSRSASIMAIL